MDRNRAATPKARCSIRAPFERRCGDRERFERCRRRLRPSLALDRMKPWRTAPALGHSGESHRRAEPGSIEMSDTSQGPGWWQASDGRWYAPEQHPNVCPPSQPPFGFPYQTPSFGPSPYGLGPPMPQQPPANRLAVASLVCSLAGILFGGITAILGVIFGFVARSQIKKSRGTQSGGGVALAGIVVGFAVI